MFKPARLTTKQRRVLEVLAENGPMSAGALVEHIGGTPQGATMTCASLVRHGRVAKTPGGGTTYTVLYPEHYTR